MHSLIDHFGGIETPCTAAVTLVDILVYFVILLNVAKARTRFKVPPPLTDGPPEFARIMRVQINTVEQIVLHLPLLWLAAFSVGDGFAALVGCLWPVGRVVYARGYYREAKSRMPGFFICMASNAFLLIAGIVGVLVAS